MVAWQVCRVWAPVDQSSTPVRDYLLDHARLLNEKCVRVYVCNMHASTCLSLQTSRRLIARACVCCVLCVRSAICCIPNLQVLAS